MNTGATTNDQGVVFKKVHTQYHVRSNGEALPCVLPVHLRDSHSLQSVAVGDRVRYAATGDGLGLIMDVLPRRNKLSRPAPKPEAGCFEQIIAANVDQVVPVFSTASPIPKWGLLDRYLVAAEAAELPALICISKLDLDPGSDNLLAVLARYRQIGYRVLTVSALTGEGLPELIVALQDRVSVLVGKSGVGKTSLLNALEPGLGLRVREVTRGRKGKGRHTTTHLEMHPLEFGGAIVDTPGIREFGLWDLYADELAWCFLEMQPYIGNCKFGLDCRHDVEPGCAVRKAVMADAISPQRYQSYMRLLEELP
jgi:ribosome biogenesis GTPase